MGTCHAPRVRFEFAASVCSAIQSNDLIGFMDYCALRLVKIDGELTWSSIALYSARNAKTSYWQEGKALMVAYILKDRRCERSPLVPWRILGHGMPVVVRLRCTISNTEVNFLCIREEFDLLAFSPRSAAQAPCLPTSNHPIWLLRWSQS